jgi:hypothetical protein
MQGLSWAGLRCRRRGRVAGDEVDLGNVNRRFNIGTLSATFYTNLLR